MSPRTARAEGLAARQRHPVTPFRNVSTQGGLLAAVVELGTPAVLKTAAFGYDGKGQVVIRKGRRAEAAWQTLKRQECILEGLRGVRRRSRSWPRAHWTATSCATARWSTPTPTTSSTPR
ncbi:MAG: ATP-grasp domain-containing protein [Gammaproteobacteria bacterium]